MKLWHDDIRSPPDDSWLWARTNEEAIKILQENDIELASLDHDLGLESLDPYAKDAWLLKGQGEKTGVDLVKWMVENNRVPPEVIIHSWNTPGAHRMASILFGSTRIVILPYTKPTR